MLLKGSSGFISPFLHVNAPYDCNGLVFVEDDDPDYGQVWSRIKKDQAEREGMKIIKCSKCTKPAVQLDHLWPYYDEQNLCEDHNK